MRSPVDEFAWSRRQGVDGVVGQKDCVAGGLGELLDAGSDVEARDGVLGGVGLGERG